MSTADVHWLNVQDPATGEKRAACGIKLGGMGGDTADRRTMNPGEATCEECRAACPTRTAHLRVAFRPPASGPSRPTRQ